jgi:hypothetical protein
MLTASIAAQGFEAVAWRDLKVIDLLCRVDGKKFSEERDRFRIRTQFCDCNEKNNSVRGGDD